MHTTCNNTFKRNLAVALCFIIGGGSGSALANEWIADQWGWQAKQQKEAADQQPPTKAQQTTRLSEPDTSEANDTFGAVTPALDILQLSSNYSDQQLSIRIAFNMKVLPCESGQGVIRPDEVSVNGFIDLDTDQNPATGGTPFVDQHLAQPSGMGQDYYLDLCSYSSSDGSLDVVQGIAPFAVTGKAKALYSGTTLVLQVPLSVIGGDDGRVNLAAVVGTMAATTDIAPNSGSLTSSPAPQPTPVPLLPPLALVIISLITGLIGGVSLARRQRDYH